MGILNQALSSVENNQDFEWAISSTCNLVTLYCLEEGCWSLVRGTMKRVDAYTICQLENSLGRELYAFPVGWEPTQTWASLERQALNTSYV